MLPSTARCEHAPTHARTPALRQAVPPHLRFATIRIRAYSDGIWEPHPNGANAVVLNVPDATGERFDIVAWFPAHPRTWWLRRGRAVLLGASNIPHAERAGTPLVVQATPARWLAAGGTGACVLDWSADLRVPLGGVADLVAKSEPHASRLAAALGRGPAATLQQVLYRHAN
jgi:hypothetical protein